jgi:hypothetical protein
MDFAWILGIFFIFTTVIFMILAFFLPEWIGLSGETAKKITAHQTDQQEEPPEALAPNIKDNPRQ